MQTYGDARCGAGATVRGSVRGCGPRLRLLASFLYAALCLRRWCGGEPERAPCISKEPLDKALSLTGDPTLVITHLIGKPRDTQPTFDQASRTWQLRGHMCGRASACAIARHVHCVHPSTRNGRTELTHVRARAHTTTQSGTRKHARTLELGDVHYSGPERKSYAMKLPAQALSL